MKWNLRWAAARRDIWRPSDLLKAFEEAGFTPSLSKVAALWSGKPTRFRLVHHAEVISLKGDSYRLKDRDLGRIPAQATEE